MFGIHSYFWERKSQAEELLPHSSSKSLPTRQTKSFAKLSSKQSSALPELRLKKWIYKKLMEWKSSGKGAMLGMSPGRQGAVRNQQCLGTLLVIIHWVGWTKLNSSWIRHPCLEISVHQRIWAGTALPASFPGLQKGKTCWFLTHFPERDSQSSSIPSQPIVPSHPIFPGHLRHLWSHCLDTAGFLSLDFLVLGLNQQVLYPKIRKKN